MLIHEIAKLVQDKPDEVIRIRHGKFLPGEYLEVDGEYPNFYSNWSGKELIEWYPSLEDLMATDWEILQ